MTEEQKIAQQDEQRQPWTRPAVLRFDAGSAETGPGANGETNSLS